MQTGEALGRSIIVEKDRTLSIAAKFEIDSQEWFICDDNTVRINFKLIPEEVLKYIREKAFTIAGVEDDELIADVKKRLEKAVADGTDFKDFKSEVNKIFDSYGVTGISSNHLQTVFRTNVYSAYSIGQFNQVMEMPDRFPMWRYFAVLDSRTRPYHRELNGRIYRVGEGPIPPIDYNCRCTAQYLHTSIIDEQSIPNIPRAHFLPPPDEGKYNSPIKFSDKNPKIKLDIKKSFKEYLNQHQDALTPPVKAWLNSKT
jgi:SPP1 gp7 family putative phage head morphogenesis protein